MATIYDDAFYKNRNDDTRYSAVRILKLLFDKMGSVPESMVDVGCGVGTWLDVAHTRYGVKVVAGLDGDYVPTKYLRIEGDSFNACNLEDYQTQELLYKYCGDHKFGLACSLEVAEHITKKNAGRFVDRLCELSDVVLFSAALAKQGGAGHVNEQRLSYWVKLFAKNGYQLCDVIRADIWNDRKIPVWYRNNVVIFCNSLGGLEHMGNTAPIADVVHPDLYETKIALYEEQLKELRRYGRLGCFVKKQYQNWKELSRK